MTSTPPCEPNFAIEDSREPVSTKMRPKILSVMDLQAIVDENILHPPFRERCSKQKTQRLVNYTRMLREYVGTDESPDLTKGDMEYLKLAGHGESPDYSDTPFIKVGKNAIVEREKEESILRMIAGSQMDRLVVLSNRLSGIPAVANFPSTVDVDGIVQRINARLSAGALGSTAGVVTLSGRKRDRVQGLRQPQKDARNTSSSWSESMDDWTNGNLHSPCSGYTFAA